MRWIWRIKQEGHLLAGMLAALIVAVGLVFFLSACSSPLLAAPVGLGVEVVQDEPLPPLIFLRTIAMVGRVNPDDTIAQWAVECGKHGLDAQFIVKYGPGYFFGESYPIAVSICRLKTKQST